MPQKLGLFRVILGRFLGRYYHHTFDTLEPERRVIMKKLNVFLIWLLVCFFLGACRTPTPAPTNIPTSTPTPTPLPTTTPVAGLDVPTSGGRWQVTVDDARHETELTTGTFLDKTTYTPTKVGYTFLVVDFEFRSLDPVPQGGVPSQAIAVIGTDGQILTPIGIGGSFGNDYVCIEECDYILQPSNHHLAFLVKEELVNQPWKLQFPNISPIPLSVDEGTSHAFSTEISSEPGQLPPNCQLEGSPSLNEIEPLSYTYWTEDGLTLASTAVDGAEGTTLCSGVAFAELQRTGDGAALLRIDSLQGWSDLYAVEPDGQVFVLVKNGLNINAEFDPTGRYLFFTTTKLDEAESQELHVFDRETFSIRLVKAGEWVQFRFLANDRLLITVQPINSENEQSYLGQLDASGLEPIDLPGSAYYFDIADDGEHLVYTELDDEVNDHLFIANLDGSNAQKVFTAKRLWATLYPDQLFSCRLGESGRRSEIYSRTTQPGQR
jgi:hypothetical protein